GRGPLVEQAAAVAGAEIVADSIVGREGTLAQAQGGAGLVVDAGPLIGTAMNDGQAGDGHGRPAGDVEDAAGAGAADGALVGPRPSDLQVLADRQLTLCQGNRLTVQLVVELDLVPRAGRGDDGPKCAGRPVVGGTGDGECAGDRAQLQWLHARSGAAAPRG